MSFMSTVEKPFCSEFGSSSPSEFPIRDVGVVDRSTLKIGPLSATNGYRLLMRTSLGTKDFAVVNKLVGQFYSNIRNIPSFENLAFRQREVDRGPGYVIDLLIVITASNRIAENSLYEQLSRLMRENKELLFDFRIIRRQGRTLAEVVPHDYLEYGKVPMVV